MLALLFVQIDSSVPIIKGRLDKVGEGDCVKLAFHVSFDHNSVLIKF